MGVGGDLGRGKESDGSPDAFACDGSALGLAGGGGGGGGGGGEGECGRSIEEVRAQGWRVPLCLLQKKFRSPVVSCPFTPQREASRIDIPNGLPVEQMPEHNYHHHPSPR